MEYPWDDRNLWILLVIPVAGFCGHISLFTVYHIAADSCLVISSVRERLEPEREPSFGEKRSCQACRKQSQLNCYLVSWGIAFPSIPETVDTRHSDWTAVSAELLQPLFSRALTSFCVWQVRFNIGFSASQPAVPASSLCKKRQWVNTSYKIN